MTINATRTALGAPRAAKALAAQAIRRNLPALLELSHDLHRHPELSFAEHRSAAVVAALLEEHGYRVERPAYGLATAFEAVLGDGELVVTVCAEYDALPDIGHGCGHNIIAAAAVGAGLALVHLASVLGCTVKVLGTPAEERGGGKVLLVEHGAFYGVGAAMMVHPAPADGLRVNAKATVEIEVEIDGDCAAAVDDALTVAEVGIGLARQHLPSGQMLHGVSEVRGLRDARRCAHYQLRADSLDELEGLEQRLDACFSAGALAAGASHTAHRAAPAYATFLTDEAILEHYRRNAEALGRRFLPYPPAVIATDMANVSHVVPSIHPAIGVDSYPAMNHSAGFATACVGPSADRAVADGATALAWTIIDLALDEIERSRLIEGQLAKVSP